MKKITCSQRRIRTTDCKVRAYRVTTTLYGFLLKTAYLHRLAVDLFTFKFFNYEKFSIPIKWIITINMMSNKVDEAGFKPATLVLTQGFIN